MLVFLHVDVFMSKTQKILESFGRIFVYPDLVTDQPRELKNEHFSYEAISGFQ